jgi:hypothetical protein
MLVESEAALLKRVRVALAASGCLVFRNTVGVDRRRGGHIPYGLGKGSSDVVAIVPPYGRWLCVETKRAKYGLITDEQKAFIDRVRRFGAVAGVVTSVSEAMALADEARGLP